MALLTTHQQRECLLALGWPLDRPFWQRPDALWWAVVTFQEMAGIGVDGIWGPQTQFAAYLVGSDGGRVTEHFAVREMACRCWERGHHGPGFCNGWPTARRALLLGLERLRAANAGPVSIVNGHRCPPYNQLVGGASKSQHVEGTAADVSQRLTLDPMRRLRVFGGIGYRRAGKLVLHVDVRAGDPASPTTWQYG